MRWLAVVVGFWCALAVPALAADCSPAGVAVARRAFQGDYDAGHFSAAENTLDALRRDCVVDRPIDPALAAAIASDLAIAAHRADDDETCLVVLQDYAAWNPAAPAMAKLPPRLREAMAFNFRQCMALCAEHFMHATCQGIRISQELETLVPGDFRERPCPFATGGSPTLAFPDGACLAVLAPRQTGWESTQDIEDPDKSCPRLMLATQRDGHRVIEPMSMPDKSFLRRGDYCCAAIDIGMDGAGRIEIAPADNPPEDCRTGHRAPVLQDIFVRDGRRLVLRHGMEAD